VAARAARHDQLLGLDAAYLPARLSAPTLAAGALTLAQRPRGPTVREVGTFLRRGDCQKRTHLLGSGGNGPEVRASEVKGAVLGHSPVGAKGLRVASTGPCQSNPLPPL
jgi:hypothetical protein